MHTHHHVGNSRIALTSKAGPYRGVRQGAVLPALLAIACSTPQRTPPQPPPRANRTRANRTQPGRRPPQRIEVQGHRGARGVRPENTLAAFRYALQVGADVLELDVQATRDDHLVVSHDPHIEPHLCQPTAKTKRQPNAAAKNQPTAVSRKQTKIPIRTLTLAAVRRYDCGSRVNPRFPTQKPVPGAKIPTLKEVLALLAARPRRYRHVRLNIELKSVPARPDLFPTPDRFATLLLNTLRRYRSIDIVARTTVQSFDHRTLAALRRRAPKITLAVLTGKSTQHYVRLLRELDAQIISPNHLWITKTDVAAVHRAGGRVIPWTANHPRQWKRLADAGVDGIITDYPGRLIQFLKKNGRR